MVFYKQIKYTKEIIEEVIEKKLDIKTGGAAAIPVTETFKPSIQFNDVDYTQGENNTIQEIIAPKDYDTLKQKSDDALMRQKAEALAEEDDDIVKLNITDSPVDLGIEITDIESRNPSPIPSEFDFKIEELPDLMSS